MNPAPAPTPTPANANGTTPAAAALYSGMFDDAPASTALPKAQEEEHKNGFTKTSEALEHGDRAIKLGAWALGAKAPELPIEYISAPINAVDDMNKQSDAIAHNDYVKAGEATISGAKELTTIGALAARGLSSLGVKSLGAVGAAAGDLVPVLGALERGYKGGEYLAKNVADNKDYARDVDGNHRFGTKADGSAKTRMDGVIDDAQVGQAAGGGGSLGKLLAINNAAVSGMINGVESIPDALKKDPRREQQAERNATEGTVMKLGQQMSQGLDLRPMDSADRQDLFKNVMQKEYKAEQELMQGHSYLPGCDPAPQHSGKTAEDKALTRLGG